MTLPRLALPATVAALAVTAQTLEVYSEFRRLGPNGAIVQPDRTGKPREIISPAVARNAFATFQLLVSAPAGRPYALHIGDNPADTFQYTLYREHDGAGSPIPDRLDKIALPVETISTGAAVSYWLDVWVPRGTPPSRIRVEAQLNVGPEWVIYPMEVRVLPATIPPHEPPAVALPQPRASSVQAAFGAMQAYLCPTQQKQPIPAGITIRHLIRRNAAQDMALAQSLEPALGSSQLRKTILGLVGAPDAEQWCTSRLSLTAAYDPETYLKVRDYLFKNAVK